MVDILHMSSINILEAKKRALRHGDENLLAQVGRGKDLMSILCVYPSDLPSDLGLIYVIVKKNMEAEDQDKLPDSELLSQMT